MSSQVIKNTTCFNEHAKRCKNCKKKSCKHWFDNSENQNCTIIASNEIPHTYDEISKMLKMSPTSIKDVERHVLSVLRTVVSDSY